METNKKDCNSEAPNVALQQKEENKIWGVTKKIANKTKAGFNFAKDAISNTIDEQKQKHQLEKEFKDQSCKCVDLITNQEFYAKKNIDENTFLIPVKNKLNLRSVITSNGQNYELIDSDFTIHNFNKENNSQTLQCYLYKYEIKIAAPIQNHTINQSVTIQGNNTGDISLVAQTQKHLSDIYNAIQNSKPGLLNKSKKTEALELYGNFKNCIINKQKDDSLFDRFLKVLSIVAPSIVSITTSLISTVFPH